MVKDDPKRAAKALILFKDKYLFLLRSDKDDIYPSYWDIPGGAVESGETLNEALIREVKEETGIDISSFKTLAIKNWEMNKGGIKVSGTDFLCILDELPKIHLSAEHVRIQWLTEKEAADSTELPVWLKDDVGRAIKLNRV